MTRTALPQFLAALAATVAAPAIAQPFDGKEVLEASTPSLDVLQGAELHVGTWSLSTAASPDVFTARVDPQNGERVCFLSGASALCRIVHAGEHHDFIVRKDGIDYPTRILGLGPQAAFPAAYREENRGKMVVEVPEAYEMVNVAIALTPFARENEYMTYKKSDYHREVLAQFKGVADHPLVKWLDAEMRRDQSLYFWHKMNGYAFAFDARGELVRSPIYESTAWSGQANTLAPQIDLMKSFARQSRFRAFYAAHRPFYASQISFYNKDIGAPAMLSWLGERFGGKSEYDHVRVVFTPLAYGMQSVTWMGEDGFRELQPHMNFPYPSERTGALAGMSDAGMILLRGELLFTEINHGYINPPAEQYAARIARALPDLDVWMTPQAKQGYGNPQSAFLEMLNWGLIDLYNLDHAAPEDFARLWEWNKQTMVERRGFKHFREYSDFLVNLYRSRPEGTTVPDLYPRIIGWFEDNHAAFAASPPDA